MDTQERETDDLSTRAERCRALLAGPQNTDETARPFLASQTRGVSHGEIHRLAAKLFARLDDRQEALCLATADKTLCAAALLSALAGGPPLMLPYALSQSALTALAGATGCTLALGDADAPIPTGVHRRQHRCAVTLDQDCRKPLW